jgi:hypothetical protein
MTSPQISEKDHQAVILSDLIQDESQSTSESPKQIQDKTNKTIYVSPRRVRDKQEGTPVSSRRVRDNQESTPVSSRRVRDNHENTPVSSRRVKDNQEGTPVSSRRIRDHQDGDYASPRRSAAHHDEYKGHVGNLVKNFVRNPLHQYEGVGLGPMDQWIESLNKRAKKKSEHLDALNQEVVNEHILSRKELIERVNARHQNGKIYPGALLEKMDLMHRESEFDPHLMQGQEYASHIAMNEAYHEWLHGDDETPFFLWLEGHSITTAHDVFDPDYKKVNRVRYHLKHAFSVEIVDGKLPTERLLMARKQHQDGRVDNQSVLFTTQNTIAEKEGVFHKMHSKIGSTAFIWDSNDKHKFISHPHSAGKYHHSSLTGGEGVGCAGMWLVEKGKVKYISNASGHYRNSPDKFHELVMFLYEKGVLDKDVEICEISLRTETKAHQSLDEYFGWSKNNLTLK